MQNKKGLFKGLLLSAALLAFTAEARIVYVTGQGTGGTTHGDKEAACDRAYERAENNADRKCDSRGGDVMDYDQNSCHCHKISGSRDDYSCDASVEASCSIR